MCVAACLQSDYCIRIDNQWTIDGAQRAQDTSTFSACHMNHAGGDASNVARLTFRKRKAVRFFAKRDIEVGAEYEVVEPQLSVLDDIQQFASCKWHAAGK